MMQRNERTLLEPWIKYHSSLFGIENLYILDNGSTDEKVISVLMNYQKKGLNVDFNYGRRVDFENKGELIARSIIENEKLRGYKISFPMDCDEFIAIKKDEAVLINVDEVHQELNSLVDCKGVLEVGGFLFNNPYRPDQYLMMRSPRKGFFSGDSCLELDIGFHTPKSKYEATSIETNIYYFHFHNRRYHEFLFYALQKITPRAGGGTYEHLARFLENKGAGHHVVKKALMGEKKYINEFLESKNTPFPVHKVMFFPEFAKQTGLNLFDLMEESDAFFEKSDSVLSFLESANRNSQMKSVQTSQSQISEIHIDVQPIKRPTISFPSSVENFVREIYPKAKSILEYGSGGSTALAAELPDTAVFSVESDRDWVGMMQSWFGHEPPRGTVHMHHVDIGPTKEWGYPQDTSRLLHYIDYPMSVWQRPDLVHPDVVLIDGRFRVACFLAALMHIRRPTTILFDDYTDRPQYHVVEELLAPSKTVGRMAVFEAKPRALHPSEWHRFGAYFFRPE
jgi:hypothetical protein